MPTTAKHRHHQVEARRARRRYRQSLRTPLDEKRRTNRKRKTLEDGAIRFTRFFEVIGRYNREQTQTRRKARKERNENRQLSRRRPLTKRYLELVELSPEQAAREGVKRKWLPVDEKRAEGRLKHLLERRGLGKRTAVCVD